ncbi:2-polyprenyl-6-hydroxyphenyl methylase / 3-demethylubiquinone-9 3-methyltransferase [Micromonospora pattaloongensis]|uniref:2-polyprenyl-6-hydroxyphenyl methylase / 3-demethylubiquinone-9 3-methyltransferase n=1 Tax=Micromonospora pattaloongensis TaxID=405436 RepID=A0A1H3H768_9ACTN|nr:methyltransferase domain-containing protein [Micromonospora pattaloongensis]SDY11267.1 2-polyprenyl-6-hydroxyphenyl methylase / 3-demethylubiquinone-9 3-methyltransferase [Micromonospora pattaloongensis]
MRTLPRNDPRQYDELADQWWRPDGAFEMLHWLAEARARLIPPARHPRAVLLDVGCGAGLLAPHVAAKGYRHVGVDLVRSALRQAGERGLTPVLADAGALPLAAGAADVVAAGELFEHVPDLPGTVAEVCRVLRPGGLLVLDTLNATALSRLLAVSVAERVPGVPRGIHDPRLFVDPRVLTAECARHGVRLAVRGIRPTLPGLLRWLVRCSRPGRARIVPTWSTAVLYQGRGTKDGQGRRSAGPGVNREGG